MLLWKILRLFIEQDGTLEGNAATDKAVREVLTPSAYGQSTESAPMYANGTHTAPFQESPSTHAQAEAVDSSTVEQIRRSLLVGDRESAVWNAARQAALGPRTATCGHHIARAVQEGSPRVREERGQLSWPQ